MATAVALVVPEARHVVGSVPVPDTMPVARFAATHVTRPVARQVARPVQRLGLWLCI